LSASTHTQKLSRFTIEAFAGMPRASRTCSRRYRSEIDTPRFGFAFIQQASSSSGSSPTSMPHT
jgi:hypothetical protein